MKQSPVFTDSFRPSVRSTLLRCHSPPRHKTIRHSTRNLTTDFWILFHSKKTSTQDRLPRGQELCAGLMQRPFIIIYKSCPPLSLSPSFSLSSPLSLPLSFSLSLCRSQRKIQGNPRVQSFGSKVCSHAAQGPGTRALSVYGLGLRVLGTRKKEIRSDNPPLLSIHVHSLEGGRKPR
jgi:hypothetical protein